MKTFITIISAFLLTVSGQMAKAQQDKCYYFCFSKPITTDTTNFVLYTDIKDTLCTVMDEGSIAKRWAEYVNRRCKTVGDCSSDLNYYRSKEDAQKNLDELLRKLTGVYKIEKVPF